MHCSRLRSVRPKDTVLEIGIGPRDEIADYYLIGDDTHDGGDCNTFSKEQAERFVEESNGRWRILEVRKVPLVNINRVIAEQFGGALDLLSSDTEGYDIEILRSLDFTRFRPAVVCVEVNAPGNSDGSEITKLLHSNGYRTVGCTFVNTVFVDDRRRPT
jgi:hypothetical protein